MAEVVQASLRDRIIDLLSQGPMSWIDLEEATGRTRSAISRQIIKLEKDGLIVREKIKNPARRGHNKDFWKVPKVLIRRI